MVTGSVLAQSVEQKGTFALTGDLSYLKQYIDNIPFEYGERDEEDFDVSQLPGDMQDDMQKFLSFFNPTYDWTEALNQIPRKKNGTFAKGRVTVLAEGHSFSWQDEESYGMRGPRLYIKTLSDTEAKVDFGWTIIEKW